MKTALTIAALLLSTLSARADGCRGRADGLLVGPDHWERMGRYFNGEVPVAIRTSVLDADEDVSLEVRRVLEDLEDAGGRGRYESVDFGVGHEDIRVGEAVRVLSPPRRNIYGSAFGEVFERLDAYGIPVFVQPYMVSEGDGYMVAERFGSGGAKAIVVIKPGSGNIALRHELRHVRDYVAEAEAFKRLLPALPETVVRLLERMESGEALTEGEQRTFFTAVNLIHFLGEMRASKASLKSLFTPRGFKEIVLTHGWKRELFLYVSEMSNASRNNAYLVRDLSSVAPSRRLLLLPTVKAVFFYLSGTVVTVAVKRGILVAYVVVVMYLLGS